MSFSYRQVATVHNDRHALDDADWGTLESALVMEADCAAGLTGLETWSHVIVVFALHLDPERETAALVRRPRGRADMPLLGVFAQRGRMRPNPIGVTTVPIVRVEPGRLIVRGLDAVDGTPVLDLKPWAAAFDRPREPREPAWFTELMRGYF